MVGANGNSVLLEILCVLLACGTSGGVIRSVLFRFEIKESINWRKWKYVPAHQDLYFKYAYSNVGTEILHFVVMVSETEIFNTH